MNPDHVKIIGEMNQDLLSAVNTTPCDRGPTARLLMDLQIDYFTRHGVDLSDPAIQQALYVYAGYMATVGAAGYGDSEEEMVKAYDASPQRAVMLNLSASLASAVATAAGGANISEGAEQLLLDNLESPNA